MKLIPLTQGKFAKVDDEDYEWLNQWRWHFNDGYARRNSPWNGGRQRQAIRMHRVIMNAPKDMEIDHIDLDKLNNQKSNLRICTKKENRCNRERRTNNKSGFKGVCWSYSNKKWQAQITVNNKCTKIGCFTDLIEAAHAYDREALKNFGEFARVNFPKKR